MDDSYGSMIFGLFLSAICGAIAASIAARKRRNGLGWFLLGMIFGPIAILVVAVASPLPDDEAGDADPEKERVDALVKLDGLRERGAITAKEFETQKARLLTGEPPAGTPEDGQRAPAKD